MVNCALERFFICENSLDNLQYIHTGKYLLNQPKSDCINLFPIFFGISVGFDSITEETAYTYIFLCVHNFFICICVKTYTKYVYKYICKANKNITEGFIEAKTLSFSQLTVCRLPPPLPPQKSSDLHERCPLC